MTNTTMKTNWEFGDNDPADPAQNWEEEDEN